jgi:hypothetical protein
LDGRNDVNWANSILQAENALRMLAQRSNCAGRAEAKPNGEVGSDGEPAGKLEDISLELSMTFDEAITQLETAAREHGVALENLVARLRSGAISNEQFVSQMRPLHESFEKIVEELTREAKSSDLAAIASLKAPEPESKN